MYRNFFGLTSLPFKTTPELEMFYKEGSREQILEALLYTVIRGDGIVKVTGEVGSGKTMLLRLLANRLPEEFEVIYINSPNLSAKDILLYICTELRIDISNLHEKFAITNALKSKLLDLHAADKRVVMLVDEAQAMTFDALEEIRLLSNIETNDDKLLQMVLFGQPELDVALENDKIRQLKSRISYSIYVPALSPSEVQAYLNYRMRQSGYTGLDFFNYKSAKRIQKLTSGLPRNINVLADKILMSAFGSGDAVIKPAHFKNLPDLEEPTAVINTSNIILYSLLTVIVILLAGLFYFYLNGNHVLNQTTIVPQSNNQTLSGNGVQSNSNELLSENNSHRAAESMAVDDGAVLSLNTIEEAVSPVIDQELDLVESNVSVPAAVKTINLDDQKAVLPEGNVSSQTRKISSSVQLNSFNNIEWSDELLDQHNESKAWLMSLDHRYVIQLSTRHIRSLDATLKFYNEYKISSDSVNILIDFNSYVQKFRLKVFYKSSNSFSALNREIDNLPIKVKRSSPYVVTTSKLVQKLQRTEQKLKEVGILDE